jgi:hypothetical protein
MQKIKSSITQYLSALGGILIAALSLIIPAFVIGAAVRIFVKVFLWGYNLFS